eukprot:scaffold66811_cov30-Tisochrysis_lutea.AAC.3
MPGRASSTRSSKRAKRTRRCPCWNRVPQQRRGLVPSIGAALRCVLGRAVRAAWWAQRQMPWRRLPPYVRSSGPPLCREASRSKHRARACVAKVRAIREQYLPH